MPTVPGLIPEVRASVGATPGVNVSATAEAFGGAVGHALGQLGTVVEQAGDKIWEHAVRFQDIQNKTEADKADADYMQKAGLLHAEFSALQGDNATKAFPKYIEDLRKSREEIGKGLSNDAVRRLYDSSTQSTMGRTIFNGAGHAGSQAKAAQIDAVGSKQKMLASQAITADSPEESRYLHGQSQRLLLEKNKLQGRESGEAELYESDSAYLAARIQHISKTDPATAEKMLAENKPKLGQYYSQTQDIVLSTSRAVGTQNIAGEIWGKNSDVNGPKVALGDMEAQAEKRARELFPNDETAALHAKNAIATRWNMYQQAKVTDQREAKNDIYNLLLTGKVNNMQELLATPEGHAAYQKLDPVQQKGLDAEIGRYVKAKGQIISDANYQKLWRMAKSDDPEAVSQFLNTPLVEQPLTQQQLEKLTTVRKQLTKDPKADPRTTTAMGYIRAARGEQLQALRIWKRADNVDEYDKFVGALVDAMDNYTEVNKKPAGRKEIVDEIAPALLQSHSVPRLFGLYTGTESNYIVPDEFSRGMKAKAMESGITVNDRQIRRAYVQTLMKKYQPAKASSGTE